MTAHLAHSLAKVARSMTAPAAVQNQGFLSRPQRTIEGCESEPKCVSFPIADLQYHNCLESFTGV